MIKKYILLIFFLLPLSASSAHAYLDPGAGSVVLQIILGGVAGIAIVLKLFWRKIKSFFKVRKQKDVGTE
jgi:hypothetical protein